MKKSKLNEILEKHRLWLNREEGGIRADLRDANLGNASLWYANLRDANLINANLSNANLRKADLRNADLYNADLRNADLRNADLDFSSMPLWCGDLKAHYDDKQIIQQLYHVLSHAKYSKNASEELKKILSTDDLKELANRFHRIDEVGEI